MLLNQNNVSVPVFDTTLVHCEAAVAFALSEAEGGSGKPYTHLSSPPETALKH